MENMERDLEELLAICERNFPFLVREKGEILRILSHSDNIILEERDEEQRLIGVSVINQNTVLLLCVDAAHRKKGIGSRLLKESERVVKETCQYTGKITVGAGFDYLMPGVPTSKRYFAAENEELYQGLDKTASHFFEKRGYVHSWGGNCFDMRLPLEQFRGDRYPKCNAITIDGILYRQAALEDLDAVCACTDSAYEEFTMYYQGKELYNVCRQSGSNPPFHCCTQGENRGNKDCPEMQPECLQNPSMVLIAVLDGEVVGTLIVTGDEDGGRRLGRLACITVRQECRGKHIAVNLVTLGTAYLKDIGMEEVYLGYTYSGLDHVYGYAGYKICVYYMMAEKELQA